MITLPTSYLGPVSYYKLLSDSTHNLIEAKEHFLKQTFRNRCYIYGANGKLSLSIPLQKWKNNTSIDEIKLSYTDNWQKVHWKSIESAYRASPFFEFYEEEFRPFYENKNIETLLDFNQQIQNCILKLLKLNPKSSFTEDYQFIDQDWRKLIHPKSKAGLQLFKIPKYMQVFEDKHGFISNLSIIDVLFNLGPRTKDYINSIEFK